MIEISYDIITVQEMFYILSNRQGWCDADKRCVIIR